jgi:hypothetical protein
MDRDQPETVEVRVSSSGECGRFRRRLVALAVAVAIAAGFAGGAVLVLALPSGGHGGHRVMRVMRVMRVTPVTAVTSVRRIAHDIAAPPVLDADGDLDGSALRLHFDPDDAR